jgi:hypothetical protein
MRVRVAAFAIAVLAVACGSNDDGREGWQDLEPDEVPTITPAPRRLFGELLYGDDAWFGRLGPTLGGYLEALEAPALVAPDELIRSHFDSVSFGVTEGFGTPLGGSIRYGYPAAGGRSVGEMMFATSPLGSLTCGDGEATEVRGLPGCVRNGLAEHRYWTLRWEEAGVLFSVAVNDRVAEDLGFESVREIVEASIVIDHRPVSFPLLPFDPDGTMTLALQGGVLRIEGACVYVHPTPRPPILVLLPAGYTYLSADGSSLWVLGHVVSDGEHVAIGGHGKEPVFDDPEWEWSLSTFDLVQPWADECVARDLWLVNSMSSTEVR